MMLDDDELSMQIYPLVQLYPEQIQETVITKI
jgi:hypothetical protein